MYEVTVPVLVCLSCELLGLTVTCSGHGLWGSRERPQWGKGVGAERKGKIQQSGARQRAEGHFGEVTEGKGQNKKIAWRKPQRGDRGRYGICGRQLTKHNIVESESSVPSVLLCVGHHCWTLGVVLVFYCPRGHFTFWLSLFSLQIFNMTVI